ncbi:MAG: diaminopimelate dehydrogenase [Turicibacter sp.]|nr:diaminopimelate dehydrogenase [Turicibacter sp.]
MINKRIAIAGYGNIGHHAAAAVTAAPDLELAGIIRRHDRGNLDGIPILNEQDDLATLGTVHAVLLCVPSREVEKYATHYLKLGINTVDSFDIHSEIVPLRNRLTPIATAHSAVAIIAAGWDPGTDSLLRIILEAAAPFGITYTNFGPGMSMGHSVVARSKPGVKDAISLTIPLGTSLHRRMVYVELEPTATLSAVTAAIKADPYFANDELHVQAVPSIAALSDTGHGVTMTRKARSALSDNQLFTFDMRINNPALTAQIMLSAARASFRQPPSTYTLPELPPIDLLPGSREDIIERLV